MEGDVATDPNAPLLDLVFQEARAGLCLLDSEGNVRRANEEWLRLLGRSVESGGGGTVSTRLANIQRMSAESGLEVTATSVGLDGGDGVLLRIGERTRPEASTARSSPSARETRYGLLFYAMTEAFALHEIVLDDRGEPCDYRFLELNPAFERLTGLLSSNVVGKLVTEAIPGVDPEWIKIYGKVALTGQPAKFDKYEAALGRHYDVLAYCPAPMQFAVLFLDITERKRAEEALRRSEERYRELITELPIGIFQATSRDGCTFLNAAGQQMTGLTESEALGKGWTRVLRGDDTARLSGLWADVASMEGAFNREYHLARTDGEDTWVKAWVAQRPGPRLNGDSLVGALVDITGRKVAEKALRESEELHRMVVNHMSEGVIVKDACGGVLTMNPAATGILGPVAMEMMATASIVPALRMTREDGSPLPPEEFPEAVALRTGEPQFAQVVGVMKADDSVSWVRGNTVPLKDAEGRVTGLVSTISDITERRALREQLTVAARLAAMGTLVSGVAHEINNPLTGAMAGNAHVREALRSLGALVRSGDPLNPNVLAQQLDDLVEVLVDAQGGAERIASIVKDLRVFGRPDTTRAPVRLQDVVESAKRKLPALVPARAAIRVEQGEPVVVLASRDQLELAIVNLVTNAALAIPEGNPGVITIRVGAGLNGMPQLEVTDNGSGIDPKVVDRIFDPFFTTRVVGQGMGLGLPICYAIVMAHGGALTVKSEPGKGSTFRVELPALAAEA